MNEYGLFMPEVLLKIIYENIQYLNIIKLKKF